MATATAVTDMIGLFRKELLLCGVKEGETVAVLSEMDRTTDYAAGFMTAAQDLGAHAFNVSVLPSRLGMDAKFGNVGVNPLTGNEPAIEVLKQADLMIDLVFLLFSREQLDIQKSGTRILLVVEPFDVLARMFPSQELRERVEAGERRLKKARHLRFTNRVGTDVSYELGQYPVLTEYGFTDTPGRWDHWPGGFLATSGSDDGVNGQVVMDEGDIVYPFKTYVREPIKFTIRHGRIVDIKGGLEARLLSDYMAGYRDPKAYATSHIGWGLNHNAVWTSHATGVRGIGMDGRAFYGNVLFSTGPNTELGGTNDTACHLDLPMRGCTLYLDDELIVKDGEVIPDDMKAPAR
jgi:2,5-dihydroxypyridine 5,6-dioxygenase